MVVLGQLRGEMVGLFAKQKLAKVKGEEDPNTISWDAFKEEIKLLFSDRTRATDTQWVIETYKQEKEYITCYRITLGL